MNKFKDLDWNFINHTTMADRVNTEIRESITITKCKYQ